MSHQTWQETLVAAQSAGTAVTGTAAGSLLPPQAKFTVPANYLDYVGKQLRIRAFGQMSNIVTTPGTLTLSVKMGATTVSTSPAFTLVTTAKTNVSWFLDIAMHLRVTGSSAQFIVTGSMQSESLQSGAGTTNFAGTQMWPLSAPAVGTAFDATASQQIDLQAIFSLTGNSIQALSYTLESLN